MYSAYVWTHGKHQPLWCSAQQPDNRQSPFGIDTSGKLLDSAGKAPIDDIELQSIKVGSGMETPSLSAFPAASLEGLNVRVGESRTPEPPFPHSGVRPHTSCSRRHSCEGLSDLQVVTLSLVHALPLIQHPDPTPHTSRLGREARGGGRGGREKAAGGREKSGGRYLRWG